MPRIGHCPCPLTRQVDFVGLPVLYTSRTCACIAHFSMPSSELSEASLAPVLACFPARLGLHLGARGPTERTDLGRHIRTCSRSGGGRRTVAACVHVVRRGALLCPGALLCQPQLPLFGGLLLLCPLLLPLLKGLLGASFHAVPRSIAMSAKDLHEGLTGAVFGQVAVGFAPATESVCRHGSHCASREMRERGNRASCRTMLIHTVTKELSGSLWHFACK